MTGAGAVVPKILPGEQLVVATHNEGKVRELSELLAPSGALILSVAALGLPVPEETGDSFEENAIIKARAAAFATGSVALADDSGLCVDALGGAPGVHTAEWAGPERDFTAAMTRVEEELRRHGATMPSQRRAHFVSVLALAWPDGLVRCFSGRVDGEILWPPRGTKGFGYDPLFRPEGHGRTFGEMSASEKHAWVPGVGEGLSHRAKAFAKMWQSIFDPNG